jgi:hypothetical protein
MHNMSPRRYRFVASDVEVSRRRDDSTYNFGRSGTASFANGHALVNVLSDE